MYRCQKMGVLGMAALLLALVPASQKLNAGPEPASSLNRQQQEKLQSLEVKLSLALRSGSFDSGAETAQEIASLRERWQGKRHWQTIDAVWTVKRWERLTRVPEKDRKEVARSFQARAEAHAAHARRDYQDTERLYRRELAIRIKVLGEDHPDTAASYGKLALIRYEQGQLADAQDLSTKSLALMRKNLGEEHPDTAVGYTSLAIILQARGQYGQAQPLLEKAVGLARKVLGEEHPQTACCLNNLAANLQAQGSYAQAQALFEQTLALRRKVLGEEHADTASSYNFVAGILQTQGRYDQAQPLYQMALTLRRKVLGEEDPSTAMSYNNVAVNLNAQGKYGQAQPLFEKALAIYRKVLGESHPSTAQCYNNVGTNLNTQYLHEQAQPMLEKALAIQRRVLGENHPSTADGYINLAACLQAQGKYGQAQLLLEKALTIYRQVLGEDHPGTATGYNNLAGNLGEQGKYAEARALLEKAFAIRRKLLGEEHPHTATCLNNLASNLHAQAKYSQAQPLYERALAFKLKLLRGDHPETALSYNNLAFNLFAHGKYAEARELAGKALAIRRKVLGEEHPETANSYYGMAYISSVEGNYSAAQELYEKTLAICRKALTEEHPITANVYNNLAHTLFHQGKHAEALLHFKKSLAIRRKVLGDEHPDTARCYNDLAVTLWQQNRLADAVRLLQDSLPGQEAARFHSAGSGFERALASGHQLNPHAALAVGLARLGQPAKAFAHAEASLARGLLDDFTASAPAKEVRDLAARRAQLDQKLLSLLGKGQLSADQKQLCDRLLQQRRDVLARLSRLVAAVSQKQLLPLATIQKQLAADAALVLWLDIDTLDEHQVCIVRSAGDPVWLSLPGQAKDGKWSTADNSLADRLYRLLRHPNPRDDERHRLTQDLVRQRLEPLRPHLGARDKLPSVKQLLVVATGWVARVPLEVMDTGYCISYVPSGSVHARLQEKHRALEGTSLLALGDPDFQAAVARPPEPPMRGVSVAVVLPGGSGARGGLRGGDVLLQLGKTRLESVADLQKALTQGGSLRFWRDGTENETKLPEGNLGIVIDRRPVARAVQAWREAEASPVRGEPAPPALPGTRWEVQTLARLVSRNTSLLGSEASEQRLDKLARSGKLREYRVLHLATHAVIHPERPEWSALLLARDRLPNPLEQLRQGYPVYTGELRVEAIRKWQLDADLVTLSACETALGRERYGDGLLGFAQAFLQSGARSVLLSRWPADDTATALLMLRFYENLLGKRERLKKPLPRAEALAEAREWLRGLRRAEVVPLAAALRAGKLSGTRGKVVELPVREGEVALPKGERPYAHPFYWAAFVLVGDPE